ncbi:MAG TPA: glycosyltransferase family 2 protein [Phycisphaerae bacterium]|nr:glycosyltransferase family 2 protein [Phycisphaerae bacterium]
MASEPKIAVLIPCHNEAATVGKVVDDFRRQLPQAGVYVFDNCSTDQTAAIAKAHGATVIHEPRLGKGYVVEAMFDRVEADYYVMVDGDDTYPAEKAGELLAPLMSGQADMAVGARRAEAAGRCFRPLHAAGNSMVRWLINRIFRAHLTDILSGFRAFSRRVVRSIPVVSSGFEVETELTVQVLYYRLRIVEVPVAYRGRPQGSRSKLRTFRDGARVLWKVFSLMRAFKPLTFFGGAGIVLFVLGLISGIGPIQDYLATGKVARFPRAILATGLMILSALSVFLGLLLHAINWRLKELHSVIARQKR